MTNRDDLKGLATWDSHRSAWIPVLGKEIEVAAKLGPTWSFDSYYHAFFGTDPEPAPNVAPPFEYGHHMCCVEAAEPVVLQPVIYVQKNAGVDECPVEYIRWDNDSAPRLVESKALEPGNMLLPRFDGEN